jgi:hypothetical protein
MNSELRLQSLGLLSDYFLPAGLTTFLSCFGFLVFLSFFWLLLPFPITWFPSLKVQMEPTRALRLVIADNALTATAA